jgi:UDP-N-acetylmuramoyl-tripeptide--D-alanyl-D-alanine ligase
MIRVLSYFLPIAPKRLVYMLQQVEYDSYKFADWVDTAPNLLRVQQRQQLDSTARAKITLLVAYGLWLLPLAGGLILAISKAAPLWLLVSGFAPLFAVVGLFIWNGLFGSVVVKPTQVRDIKRAKSKLDNMSAVKIAVMGSYGKTTMKDVLASVLSEGKRVAATPGNKNVLISHARWILHDVKGNEDALIFEYGEAEPGDIALLGNFSKPTYAVITGLAPAHMDGYGTLDAIADDFKSISEYVKKDDLFLNADSPELKARIKDSVAYTSSQVDGWKVSAIKVSASGVAFTMKKGKAVLKLESGLLGAHNVGPLAAVAAIAHRLGLTPKQITAGVAKTKPFEHRLQPYRLGGALIIDDTYNGNIDGMKAGLALLAALPATRKTYVTPGLVEQGALKEQVHKELGKAIAAANPNKVVLMNNSTTPYITAGLEEGNFKGTVQIENVPLDYYTNLEHFVVHDEVVLMQNDWTDNYQ